MEVNEKIKKKREIKKNYMEKKSDFIYIKRRRLNLVTDDIQCLKY